MQRSSMLQDLHLADQRDEQKSLSILLASASTKNTLRDPITYDPVQINLLKKLIPEDTLSHRVKILTGDYLDGIDYLDFFIHYIVQDSSVMDDIKRKTEELERMDPFLDTNLEFCVRLCSLHYMSEYRSLSSRDRRRSGYGESDPVSSVVCAKYVSTDPLYDAAAEIYLALFTQEISKKYLPEIQSLNDAKALHFIDINARYLIRDHQWEDVESEIESLLDQQQFLKAAHFSMEKVAEHFSMQRISSFVQTIERTRY